MDFDSILGLIVAFFVILPLVGLLAYIFISSYQSTVKEQAERMVLLNDISIALKNIDSSLESITYSIEGIHEKIDDIDSLTIRLKEDDND